jgi:DNA-binding Lrp family transcriptional regulator
MMLLANSRTSYRDLAERLGLSVNAVHKLIQAMVEEGIIRAFTARISLSALNALTVIIYGRSDSVSTQELKESGEGLEGAEGQLQLLRRLVGNGVTVAHQDASCVSCEKTLDAKEAQNEVRCLLSLIRERS